MRRYVTQFSSHKARGHQGIKTKGKILLKFTCIIGLSSVSGLFNLVVKTQLQSSVSFLASLITSLTAHQLRPHKHQNN